MPALLRPDGPAAPDQQIAPSARRLPERVRERPRSGMRAVPRDLPVDLRRGLQSTALHAYASQLDGRAATARRRRRGRAEVRTRTAPRPLLSNGVRAERAGASPACAGYLVPLRGRLPPAPRQR